MTILRSVGPVISTRRSCRSAGRAATFQSPSRIWVGGRWAGWGGAGRMGEEQHMGWGRRSKCAGAAPPGLGGLWVWGLDCLWVAAWWATGTVQVPPCPTQGEPIKKYCFLHHAQPKGEPPAGKLSSRAWSAAGSRVGCPHPSAPAPRAAGPAAHARAAHNSCGAGGMGLGRGEGLGWPLKHGMGGKAATRCAGAEIGTAAD